MTFKQFNEWCNDRACDGCWGSLEALICIDIITQIRNVKFWKREKLWKKEYKEKLLNEIINPVNDKILIMK